VTFLCHAVAPPLNSYINFLYLSEGPRPYEQDGIFPMPATDLKFNFGDPWRVHDPLGTTVSVAQSWCVGIWSRHHIVEWPTQIRFVGVSFRPGGAAAFLGVPLSELHNRVVPLDAIWGRFAGEASERLHAAMTPVRRFRLLEEILIGRLRERPSASQVVDHVSKRIADQHGALRIGDLGGEVGISSKHLIALFKRIVGCTPKQLARLHRFGHTLQSIDVTRPVDWTSVAHENDYFDQPHFIRDFEAHTGLNPTAYIKRRQGVLAKAPDHAANLAILRAG